MMSTRTLQHYILLLERVFRTSQATALASLLDLRDDHCYDKSLLIPNIESFVASNCVAPLDEIAIAHLLCVKVSDFYLFIY